MLLSNGQLLKQLHKTTSQLLQETGNAEHQALLTAMDAVLNELLLRNDNHFYTDYYHRGRQLIEEGLALPGKQSDLLRADYNLLFDRLDNSLSMDIVSTRIIKLSALMEKLVITIGHSPDPIAQSFLKRITAWELSLLAHRMKRVTVDQTKTSGQSVNINKENLQAYLHRKKPAWKNLEVTYFHRVAGGFSKCTILFDTMDSVNGKQSFAIRAEQPIHLLDLDGSDITNEYPLVKKAFESGITVAEPLWLEPDTSHLNTRFLVSRKARGANFGTAKGGEGQLSTAVLQDLAREMAAIHNIPLDRNADWIKQSHFGKWLDHGNIRANTVARVEEFSNQAKRANLFPSATVARAYNWLLANVPDYDEAPVFMHCDFGPHNILLDNERVSAVLDWEVSTPGDPAFDVSWFLNCSGAAVDRQQFIEAYKDAGGQPISEYRLRYFDVFMSMVMPITCNAALKLLEDNDASNINFAIYGLQFMHEYPSRLDAAILQAEAAKLIELTA